MARENLHSKELKWKNRNRLFQYLLEADCCSRQDLVEALGLSLPTVTQDLLELMAEGLICEGEPFENTGGRRAQAYRASRGSRVAIGVDVNRSHCSAVAVDLSGSILGMRRQDIPFVDTPEYFAHLADMARDLVAQIETVPFEVIGVGMAIQGMVSTDNRHVLYSPLLGLTGRETSEFTSVFPWKTTMLHDCDMAAFAEIWYAPELKDAFYLSISTNLGGAIITERTVESTGIGRGRIEHTTLVPGGEACYCGQTGCAEAYCSISALLKAAGSRCVEELFRRLEENDQGCQAAFDRFLDMLAIVVNNAHVMFACDVIVGGYLTPFLKIYLEQLKARAYRLNSFDPGRDYLRLGCVDREPVATGTALKLIHSYIAQV